MKVLEVVLPNGMKFYNEEIDLKAAANSAKAYMLNNYISLEGKPLTTFTVLEMTEEEYKKIGATSEANEFFINGE